MPVKHKAKQRIPLDLEPALMEHLVSTANELNIKRTVLCRIFVKFGLNNLKEAIDYGDKIAWRPVVPSDISQSPSPTKAQSNVRSTVPGSSTNNKGNTQQTDQVLPTINQSQENNSSN